MKFLRNIFKDVHSRVLTLMRIGINRIYHHMLERTRESHRSVHDLQSTMRIAELSMLQVMDMRMEFPCPFCNVVIDYFSPTPLISHISPTPFISHKSSILMPF